jgi:hypothetical protein
VDCDRFCDIINTYAEEIMHENKKHIAYLAGVWYALLLETIEDDDEDPADWWKNERV